MLIEPTGGERLLAVASDEGTVFVFDVDGTLVAQRRLPGAEEDPEHYVFSIDAGRETDGSWTLSVEASAGMFVFELGL